MTRSADVVVVGAGPAGIAAAVEAAGAGCSALLVDEQAHPGGQIWRSSVAHARPRAARTWLDRLHASRAEFLGNVTVADAEAGLLLRAECDGRPLRINARRALILATGARELFLPFPGWTLPGVVGVGGAQALLKQGMDVRGRTAVVAGTGPLLLPVAAALRAGGARVAAIVEQAPAGNVARFARALWRAPSKLVEGARYRWNAGAPYLTGTWVARAEGDATVERIRLAGAHARTLECDLLCTGYGLVGSVELARLAGCAIGARGVTVDEMQQTSVPGVYCAGESVAVAGVDGALVQGRIAGLAAAGRMADARALFGRRARHTAFAARLRLAFGLRPELARLAEDDTIVCRCEDVTAGAVAACESMREARLHTRTGMGACQGRVCGAALRHVRGWNYEDARPPAIPVSVAALITTEGSDAQV